ncbi:MAG: hypothetical protein ABSH20_05560 [Tepidisphaeraceae bacterium]|jgi:hypothetical protein
MRPATWNIASLIFAALLTTGGRAQTTRPAATTQPAAAAIPDEMLARLAGRYTRVAAGFSFCPPIGGKAQQKLAVGADEPFVVFASDADRWTLKVLQLIRPEPTRLATPRMGDPAAGVQRFNGANPPPPTPGLLDELEGALQLNNPGVQSLRKDVINVGRYDTGLLISRYSMGGQSWLHQQAIIQESPTHFFVIDWTTPSGWTAKQADAEDPKESVAVALFDAMLRTVQIFDTEPVKIELERRIYSGMTMGVNLARRAETALIPEQYYRVVHKGKDVGWMFVTERFDDYNGKHGLIVTTTLARKDSAGGPLMRVDAELFSTPDRKQPDEAWVSRTTVNGLDSFNEFGQSYKHNRPKIVVPKDPNKKKQAFTVEEQNLTINQSSRGETRTIERELVNPYCYLPQAWTLLLPRLLPVKEHKTYAFMAWIPSEREIIPRYVDTEGDREVRFAGKTFRAWVIRDRISLEGDATFHYFNADGVYVGSETPASGVSIVPSDFKTLKELYPNETFTPLPLLRGLTPPAGPPGPRLPAPSLLPANPGSR